MGGQRIQEVTMFTLLFLLLLGIVFLLAAAGRIWIDATPSDSNRIASKSYDRRTRQPEHVLGLSSFHKDS